MEGGIGLLILLILGVPILVAIWLISRAIQASNRIEELSQRLRSLEAELLRLKKEREAAPAAEYHPIAIAEVPQAKPSPEPEPAKPAPTPPPPEIVRPPPVLTPPPIPPQPEPVFAQTSAPKPQPAAAQAARTPPVMEPYVPAREAPRINWEQFLGVKLFAWAGGLALFLAVAFFVKYSFDNNLISPEMRVAIGFIIGIGLVVGGVVTSRKNYLVLSQTLCATGIVILYAITFAARSYYHILSWPGTWWDALPAFAIMALITATGFTLAVRLNALLVAVLGMLGGFLTPVLLSTGVDNPGGLFGYIAILDAGLIIIAVHRRWSFLTALAAAGTAMMQIAWAGDFFVKEKYFEGNKIYIALAILLGFIALYLAAAWWTKRRAQTDRWLSGSTIGLVTVALGFTLAFLTFEPLAQRPWLIFSFVFLIDLAVVALVLLDNEVAPTQPIVGLAVFGLLAFWTTNSLSNEFLNAAMVFYLVFAVVHSIFPIWLRRTRGAATILWGSQLFPPLALVLVLIPIFHFTPVSLLVWPFVLLVDILAIALAVITASILPVLVVLLLTLAATGALIFKIPETLTGLPTSFSLLGAFAVFFFIISIWLVRKFSPNMFQTGRRIGEDLDLSNPADIAAILPACSAVLPFLLLIMATMRLPLANPTPVFGLGLLLVVLLLGVTRLLSMDWMPVIGLFCVMALECAWHFSKFDTEIVTIRPEPGPPLIWYLVFFGVFAVFPFLFLRHFSEKVVPWAAAALAGPAQFLLIYRLVKIVHPNQFMGLLPAAFAIPSLLSLFVVPKRVPATSSARMSQLAWFGGVALFFITLIFPIQFENQWITIGWALEGAALLWLFHRVPHPGLRMVGFGLLVAAFVRLAPFNLYVFEYHPRAAIAIFNWYLYAYGIVTACLFVGASLLAPPRNKIYELNTPPVLFTFGTILAFYLLNIEIADYFSQPGSTLTFEFSGNFARDMTYSIAWALFALVLLVFGIWKKLPGARYSALGLLSVTILKLFFHDLASLNQLYRIFAFLGVAVIAILASVAYQRFFATAGKKREPQNETLQ